MTKNTLAAALMAGVVAFVLGGAYLSVHHSKTATMILIFCVVSFLLSIAWMICQDVAGYIIEARRERGEGPK